MFPRSVNHVGAATFGTVQVSSQIFCNTQKGEVGWWRHPLLIVFSHPKYVFSFNRYPLDTRESYDFSRLAHPWQTHYCQPPRMDQLITYFQTLISFVFHLFHSHSLDNSNFNFCQEWTLLDLFYVNIRTFSRARRHQDVAHVPIVIKSILFFLIVTHWILNHCLIRCNGRIFVIQFASWL